MSAKGVRTPAKFVETDTNAGTLTLRGVPSERVTATLGAAFPDGCKLSRVELAKASEPSVPQA